MNNHRFKSKNSTEANSKRRVVLVTGASSGLGLALAKQLISDHRYFLVLTSRAASSFRFEDELIQTAKNLWLRDLDITDHRQIINVINEINDKLGGVDILVNNAGVSERSTVEDSSDLLRQRQLDVNYLAPFELIAQVLPHMRMKRWGRIINVSSAGGFMAMPTMSAYSASKFALEAASESLWYEMKPWGIRVTLVVPGFINSLGYLNTTDTKKGRISEADSKSAYFEHYRGMRALILRSMTGARATNESIARRISQIIFMSHPPMRVHVTFEALFFYWLRKLLPSTLYHFIIFKFLPNIKMWGKNKYQIKSQGI